MGEIYLAVLKRPGEFEKRLVIKRILPALSKDPEFLAMFNREARVAALLNHQNIVQVYDYGHEGDDYFIAMEHVDGSDLRTALSALGPPPRSAAVAILSGVARALRYAHRLRSSAGKPMHLVHRDVSPGNVLLSRDGAVKLTDFGLVTSGRPDFETEAGAMKGKFAYMSPEQTYGDPVDLRSDLFSWGIVAYQLLGGQRPFRGPVVETVTAIRDVSFERLQLEDVPEGVLDLIHGCLELHIEDRPDGADQLLDRLHACATEAGWGDGIRDLADWVQPLARERDIAAAETIDKTAVGTAPIRTAAPASGDSDTLAAAAALRTADAEHKAIPRRSRGWLWGIAAVAAAVALSTAAYIEFSSPPEVTEVTDAGVEFVEPVPLADVVLTSDPPAAQVLLEGTGLGVTPLTLAGLEEGRAYQMQVRLPGYRVESRRFRVEDLDRGQDGGRALTLFLRPEPAQVRIVTEPVGASLTIDGEHAGSAPHLLSTVQFGLVEVVAEAPSHRPATASFETHPGMDETLNLQLVRLYRVTVDGAPRGAGARVTGPEGNEILACETPCEATLPEGEYHVLLARPGHESVEITRDISADEVIRYDLPEIRRTIDVSWRSSDLQLSGSQASSLPEGTTQQSVEMTGGGVSGRINAVFERAGDDLDARFDFHMRPWARVQLGGRDGCETPCSLRLARARDGNHRISIRPEGGDDVLEVRFRVNRTNN